MNTTMTDDDRLEIARLTQENVELETTINTMIANRPEPVVDRQLFEDDLRASLDLIFAGSR